tara:strand:+ start:4890 stop:5501 length:612 start_codon:yes stop_codon:yes gene_type:complete
MDLELHEVDIDTLVEYPDNPRLGDIEKIQESLLENGQYRPLTVNKNNNQILTGNHTWLAMKELGWEKCTVTYVDVDENKAKKIVLVDNRLSDVADYDNELLSKMLQDMVEDLMGTGFEQKDVDELLAEYDGEVEIEVIDIPNPKPTGQPEAVKDVVLYLDEEQFKNYKTWIEAIAEYYKCNLTEACYKAVMITYLDLFEGDND